MLIFDFHIQVVSFGYNLKQTTLLSCGFGAVTILSILLAVKLIDKTKDSRGLVAGQFKILISISMIQKPKINPLELMKESIPKLIQHWSLIASWYLPTLLGSILIITLPWSNRVGLLIGIFLATLSATVRSFVFCFYFHDAFVFFLKVYLKRFDSCAFTKKRV